MEKDIIHYIKTFKKLNINKDKIKGDSPHKPILLISIAQAYREGYILDNRIYITPALVGLFKDNWSRLAATGQHCRFPLPFFHMSNDKPIFWRLIPNSGYEMVIKLKSQMRSFKVLTVAVDYAQIDDELSKLFLDSESNNAIESFLIGNYFPNYKNSNYDNSFLDKVSKDILEDSPIEYNAKIKLLEKALNDSDFEEQKYARSHQFKREVVKNYHYSCVISRLKIDVVGSVSMLDACHIVPFSETYNDTITNGISLTPTLHRAFDRGLISISDEFKVLIKGNFSEVNLSPYSIKQFAGKSILLPDHELRLPSREGLANHRQRFGFV